MSYIPTDLLTSVSSDKMIDFKEMVVSALNQKAKDHIDARKLEIAQNFLVNEDDIDEEITQDTPAKEIIDDIIQSKDPRLNGKSKQERIKIALGIYYNLHPEMKK